jgi:hypothetical protein
VNVLVICRSDGFLRRHYTRCPVDECITEMVTRFDLWYDPTTWCTKCGDSWSGSELRARPFQRGWRAKAVRVARQLWDRATYGPPSSLDELETR